MATPTVVRRATTRSPSSNSTTWTPGTSPNTWVFTTNTAISAGDDVLWIMLVSSDGNPTLSETGGNGWTKRDQASEAGGACTGAIFTKETTGAFAASALPGFDLTSTVSEQYTAIIVGIKMATAGKVAGFLLATAAQGSSTNSGPPALTNSSGASRDCIVGVTRSGDSTVVATAAPTNYSTLLSWAAGGTGGASSNHADRSLTIASGGSENPGVFTSASEQWVSYTYAVYEQDPPPAPTSSGNFFLVF